MTGIVHNTTGISRLLWTAAIVIGASVPHWMSLPRWMPVMLLGCVAWRLAGRVFHWPLPGRKLMWIVTIIAFGAVFARFGTINGLLPGTALLVVMISLKFLEAGSQRDHILLTVLGYFLVFASLLTEGGLLKGLYLLAFVWVTTLGLLQVGRQGGLMSAKPSARLAARLLAQSIPMMIVLFLVFPRLPGPLWALPGDTGSGATGLSGSMSPGDITDLGLSDEIAFRVEFTGQVPAPSELYWRGPVLSKFDGRRWDPFDGMRGSVADTIDYLGATTRYTVRPEPSGQRWAFALEMPETWTSSDRRVPVRMGSDYQLFVFGPGRDASRITYTVTSHSRFRAMEDLDAEDIRQFTRLPEGGNPRTRQLMDELTADNPDARTIIDRGLDVFREPDYFYTLTPPALGEHTADEFIFDTKEGFCEHYASAFAIMMRMAGVPTRVVTGYQGGELNSMGDYYIIRQSDAHAWTEVWTPEEGWIRVDPIQAVAPERIAVGSSRTGFEGGGGVVAAITRMGWLRQAAMAWDAVNTHWDKWIVGYGPRLQRTLLEWFGFERPGRRDLLIITAAATIILTTLIGAWHGLCLRRVPARDRAAREFDRFMKKLSRAKIEPIRQGETPGSFAARAGATLPANAAAIESITRSYLRARYEPDPEGEALSRLRLSVQAFRPGYAPA